MYVYMDCRTSIVIIKAVTCDFQQCGIFTSLDSEEPVQPPISLETPNDVQSVAEHS